MADSLGKAVYTIDGDDSGLKNTLIRDEQLIRSSVQKNQAQFDTLTTSAQAVEGPTSNATSAVGAFGAAAALTGNQSAGMAAQVANMALQLKSAAVGAAVLQVAMIGLVVVAVALLASIIWVKDLANWWEGVADAEQRALDIQVKLDAQRQKGQDFLKKQREALAVLRGVDPLTFQVPAENLREAQANAALIAFEKQKQADAEKAIADAKARETATEATAKADAAKVMADAKQREAEGAARVAAFEARIGPQTAEAARSLLVNLNLENILRDGSIARQEKQLALLIAQGVVSEKQAEQLRRQQGLAVTEQQKTVAAGTSSAIRLASFGGASIGGGGIAPIDPAQMKRDRTQDDSKDFLRDIDQGIQRLVSADMEGGLRG